MVLIEPCYYKTLGVAPSVDSASLDKAFRRAAKQCHPDKGGDPDKFRILSKAHKVLRDPKLRNLYDRYGPGLKPGPGDHIGRGVGRITSLGITSAAGLFLTTLYCSTNWLGEGFGVVGGVSCSALGLALTADTRDLSDAGIGALGGLVIGSLGGVVLSGMLKGLGSLAIGLTTK
ncbi:unnamed protein product [Chrysoparadoxa australica]